MLGSLLRNNPDLSEFYNDWEAKNSNYENYFSMLT